MDSSTAGNRAQNELGNIIYVAEAAQRPALCNNGKARQRTLQRVPAHRTVEPLWLLDVPIMRGYLKAV